jgi:excisionase family DNA binding protein
MEKLLNPAEVAGLLGMSRVWVYKAVEKGMLPFFRVGDAIRFDPGEIRTYLEERRGLKRDAFLVSHQEANKNP